MVDLLRQGSDWLEDKRKAFAASAVTYWRGGTSVEVRASIGTTTFDVETTAGAVETIESRDFLILAADLILGGSEVLPERGDLIKELLVAGGATLVYEVLAPGGEPPWRYSDPYRKTLRIHTKHVATE